MAYRRSIMARAKSFYQHQQPRIAPSLSHITSSDCEEFPTKTMSTNSQICSRFLRNRNNSGNSSLLSANASRLIGSKIPASYGLIFHRNFSNVPSGIEIRYEGGDLNGLVGAVADKAVAAAPAVNEVAIAAANSSAPVAAFQYLIDHVHCYTGFEWWASIAATTLLIRFIGLPSRIQKLKFYSKKFPADLRARKLIQEKVLEGKDNSNIAKAMAIWRKLAEGIGDIKKIGFPMEDVNALILFFAIWNMAKEVPSFITGGTLWFVDLTTPDRICLPILSALTFWLSFRAGSDLSCTWYNAKVPRGTSYTCTASGCNRFSITLGYMLLLDHLQPLCNSLWNCDDEPSSSENGGGITGTAFNW